MPDISKYLDRANKHLQKGRHESALREYLEVLAIDSTHDQASQAAADLYLVLGRNLEAATLLRQIFDRQLAARQALAAATYKKLVKVAAVAPEQCLELAHVLHQASRKEAIEAYAVALRDFKATNQKPEALAALEGLAALDPTCEHLEALAELAVELRQPMKAATALQKAAELSSGNRTEALKLCARAFGHYPGQTTALAYAKLLLDEESNAPQVISMLQPFARGPEATPESRALYGRALLLAGRASDAVPFLWVVFEQDPGQIENVLLLIGKLLDSGQGHVAVDVARRLEHHEQHAGRLRQFALLMDELGEKHACTEFIEYLVELCNTTNREHEYCKALLRLFDLYYADGNFLKACECLDRVAEVQPSDEDYKRRLELLNGKVDKKRLRRSAGSDRAMAAVTPEEPLVEKNSAIENEPTVLEDLMLQAEIFMQYSLLTRATERLERIRKLFPGEEYKNEKLRNLYASAGMAIPPRANAEGSDRGATTAAPDQASVDNIARVNEVTRNIFRQGTVKSVLFTAVNEAGRHWNASRCSAVLCTPGKPPSIALEYCAPGVKPSDVHDVVKLIGLLQPLAIAKGPLVIGGGSTAPGMTSLLKFIARIGISSLLAMPLIEGEEHIGLLLLSEAEAPRRWRPVDTVVLKTIAEQIVLALSNVRLRSLFKNLAAADDNSGLLKRSSYLDIVESEVRRAVQQKSTMSIVLLNFGKASELVRQMGDRDFEAIIQQLGQLVRSHSRQIDLAVRYDLATIALVLADAGEKNALFAVDKLRKAIGNASTGFCSVGIAEAVAKPEFDAVDIVTEVINRAEAALAVAIGAGDNQVQVLGPSLYSSANA